MSIINKKVIGIDARFYGPKNKGIGRYVKEIVDRVTATDKDNDYVVFLARDNYDSFRPVGTNVKKVLADVRWYTFAEQVVIPRLIKKEKIDLMHFPHFNVPFFCPVNFIVTIHDLILIKFPTVKSSTLNPLFYWFKNLAYRLIIARAVTKARLVIAVSEFTKKDILEKFKIPADKVKVTLLGVASAFVAEQTNSPVDVLSTYGIVKPYLLYVGNAYPHKNLEWLIWAFEQLKEKHNELQLVLVGKEDYFYRRLKLIASKSANSKSIVFPGFVKDEDLQPLYQNALAYVFPSLYEGFGLPPLEAMSQGCPVISSDQSCMPEILDDAVLYFSPIDAWDFINQVEKIIESEELVKELVAKGRKVAQKYSWQECAAETLAFYQKNL
jgi:glycosyltransferase involved in cell wall biosynthesis